MDIFWNYTMLLRNMSQHCWVQYVACIWPPCCDMLGVVGSNLKIGQVSATMLRPGMRTSSIFNSQHVRHFATGWPNTHSMLRSTMLRSVAFKCCDCLARACKCRANIVGICCIEMLLSFGRDLTRQFRNIRKSFFGES